MRRQVALPAVVLLVLSAAGPQAQQPTFRSKTDLVVVDAVVVDKDGHAIRGLTASDFALTDRKKPQAVATFEEVSHARPASDVAWPPSLRLDVASNTGVQADRLVMVFIDDLHIWKGRTDTAKALARDVVTRLGSQASMAVVFSSHAGGTQVTQDRSALLAAIDGMSARQTFRRPHQGFLKQGAVFVDPALPKEFKLEAITAAQRASLQDLYDNLQHFQTLEDAAKMLHKEDRRRKAFVVISEGLDLDLSGLAGTASSLSDVVGQESDPAARNGVNTVLGLMDALRRANVSLYAIDPRGRVRPEDVLLESWPPVDCAVCENPPAEPEPAERLHSQEDSRVAWDNPVRKAQAGLGFMSEAAGGFAVTDTDDLTGGLSRILEDLDHYYLLGFYPADTSSAHQTHPVQLTIPGHPDYDVRFRRGYVPGGSPPPLKSKDPLAELAAGVLPKGDLPLRLTAMPLPGPGKVVRVSVALEVTAPVGLMKEADSALRDDIQYSVMVVDDKRARVTQRNGRSAKVTIQARERFQAEDPGKPEPDRVTYQIPITLDLAPGRYQLRASAMSRKLEKGGSVYLDLTVPDFSKMPLALTTIALGVFDGSRLPVGRTPGAMVGMFPASTFEPRIVPPAQQRAQNNRNPLPFEPTLSREFERTDALRTYFEVARADATSTVALEIRVLDSNNVVQLKYDRIVGPRDPGMVDLRIPLQTLGTGVFTLRITASDSRNVARTETGFIIR